jgi:hydrogenase maturation protease
VAEALVVGFGSDLRGDDGAGRRVAELVESWGLVGVRVVSVHQLTPELAADLAEVGRAVFVDADPSATRVAVSALEPEPAGAASSHHTGPAGLLHLARETFGHAPAAHLVTVPASDFTLGAPLSAATARAVPEAAAAVGALLSTEPPTQGWGTR